MPLKEEGKVVDHVDHWIIYDKRKNKIVNGLWNLQQYAPRVGQGRNTSVINKAHVGAPIRIFYANLLRSGVKLKVVDGQLRVGGNLENLSPVYREEILKRAEFLVDLLTPSPSPEMASHFGRLLTLDELKAALHTAEFLGDKVDSWPVDGGWLLTTSKLEKRKELV